MTQETGLKGRIYQKSLLRRVNETNRFQWAREHQPWALNEWEKVFLY